MEDTAILTKLSEHDNRFDRVENKLLEHDERFERVENKLLEHDERFDRVENKLLEHDGRFDAIAKKLLEHDDRFDRLEDRLGREIGGLRAEMLQGQDEMMVILRRLDQERVFTSAWVKRIETRVDTYERGSPR